MAKSVAIIGGGMLGLSLAYELAHKSFKVTIYEKNSDWGGLASGIKLGDSYIEKYYHHWFKSDTAIQNLIKELGLGNKLIFPESSMGIYYDGKVHSFGGSVDLLKFKPLNIFNRLRAGVVSLMLSKMPYRKSFESISAIEWCNKFFGKNVSKVIWEPLLMGKFGRENYKKVSMAWLWARITDRSSSRPSPISKEYLGYLDGGFQVLIDALVEKLEEYGVELVSNVNVQSHKLEKSKHILTIDGKPNKFDIVISTVPGPIFTKIFNVTKKQQDKIHTVKYLGATCMLLELEHSISPYYWLNVNDPKAPFLAIVEHTNFVAKEKYNDKIIVYIAKYVDPKSSLFAKSEEELLDLYCKYLPKINPDFKKDWVKNKYFFKSAFAQHIVTKNYEVLPYETEIDGLYYANFTQIYPHDRGTNYAVEQAKTLSDIIVSKYGN